MNAKNLEKKRNDYDKPWLEGLKPKTSKGGRRGEGFLYSVYPDGVGPDDDLIKMLEKEVVERSPGITFDDIAELDRAKRKYLCFL